MDEEEVLRRFGLPPEAAAADAIRWALRAEVEQERAGQGLGDTAAMRLLCAQLFWLGEQADVLRIWEAKRASFDAGCSIDVELLCLTGVEATRAWLAEQAGEAAREALATLERCVAAGDFEGFGVEGWRVEILRYYGG